MTYRAACLTLLLLLSAEGIVFSKLPAPAILTIQFLPERPIVELRDNNQFLNFDMVVRNVSDFTVRISQMN